MHLEHVKSVKQSRLPSWAVTAVAVADENASVARASHGGHVPHEAGRFVPTLNGRVAERPEPGQPFYRTPDAFL
jgi:hypothetical protein